MLTNINQTFQSGQRVFLNEVKCLKLYLYIHYDADKINPMNSCSSKYHMKIKNLQDIHTDTSSCGYQHRVSINLEVQGYHPLNRKVR
jgi:hypothetical protein